ncbi:CapA family protein [Bilifractor porci]|nr:CapA family protein [Bilifractor porci]
MADRKKSKEPESFYSRVTGEKDIQRADKILRSMEHGIRPVTSEGLNRVRKILQRQKRRQSRLFLASCILAGLLILVLLVSLIGSAIRRTSGGSAGNTSTNTPGTGTESVGTASSSSSVTPTAGAEPTSVLMSFTGDCILGTDENFIYDTSFNAAYDKNGAAWFLQNVSDTFAADDLTCINLECALTDRNTREDKEFAFKGDPAYTEILTDGSVEAADLANNHSHDYGDRAYDDTVDNLKGAGITPFGYDDVALYEVKDKNVTVGLTGIYELDDHLDCEDQIKTNIQSLKDKGADIVVCAFHWGVELSDTPDENQVTLAHYAIDNGADLVIGHHPHIIQGIESYKGKYIAYSLGNFCFGGNTSPTETDTIIFQADITLDADRTVTGTSIKAIPCSITSDSSTNNYQPQLLTGDSAQATLQKLVTRSGQILTTEYYMDGVDLSQEELYDGTDGTMTPAETVLARQNGTDTGTDSAGTDTSGTGTTGTGTSGTGTAGTDTAVTGNDTSGADGTGTNG